MTRAQDRKPHFNVCPDKARAHLSSWRGIRRAGPAGWTPSRSSLVQAFFRSGHTSESCALILAMVWRSALEYCMIAFKSNRKHR